MHNRPRTLNVLSLIALSFFTLTALPTASAQGSPQVSAYLAPPSSGPDPQTFEQFLRFPTEVQNFITMNGTPPTAYYRDEFVGGETLTTGANDGDAIYAQLFDANNNLLSTWSSFVFHATYSFGGQTLQNCWVAPGIQPLCGSNSIDVLWYYQAQCGDGGFGMQFYLNNVPIASSPFPFKILPQIEESRVPTNNQVPYAGQDVWAYDSECRFIDNSGNIINSKEKHTCSTPYLSNEIPYYIRAKGCYLTDATNILTYHGVTVDPPTLNTYLKGLAGETGYTHSYGVNPRGVHQYSVQQGGNVSFVESDLNFTNLNKNICTYGPQILGVHCVADKQGHLHASHWVTAYGQSSDKSTWLIHDPNGGRSGTLASLYNNQACESRSYSGPQFSFETETGLIITFHSPVSLLLTDSLGRRTGDDPSSSVTYNEVPGAFYDAGGLEDDELLVDEDDPAKEIFVPSPASGQYTLTATGTDNGAYSAEFVAYDSNGTATEADLQNVPISLGQAQNFTLNYSSTPGTPLQLTGGFDGGGQNPASVNKFLSYAAPMDSHVTLATGTQSYGIVIFYSSAIIPGTLSATLNGTDVSAQFHPNPGTSEGVTIPLTSGRNVLNLQISGNLPNRVATDTDRLVFDVQ